MLFQTCAVFQLCTVFQTCTVFDVVELSQLLRRLHESFLIVAANLQSVHEAVKVSSS